ncbi:hypothetical protein HU200_012842 [Digitaria exilis]|uniref:Rhodanese domain-containing protein n=1 Tax=Digitaria exilis TaxID=1010633 RepID=A0A835KLI3_9POAL|nr:hypothetical protein HU200_012842 [Digitaria exilis]
MSRWSADGYMRLHLSPFYTLLLPGSRRRAPSPERMYARSPPYSKKATQEKRSSHHSRQKLLAFRCHGHTATVSDPFIHLTTSSSPASHQPAAPPPLPRAHWLSRFVNPAARRRPQRSAPPRPPSAARGGLARLSGGVALGLSLSHAGAGAALAAPLSYEEMLRLSTDSDSGAGGFALPGLDLGGFALPDLGLDGLADFVSENPLVVAAGVAAVALPLLLAQLLGGGGGSKPYSVVSARAAYQRLLEEPAAQLVDIRTRKDAQEDGAPDLREAKKKVVAVPYSGEDKNGFLKKLALRLKDPENTILIILDK